MRDQPRHRTDDSRRPQAAPEWRGSAVAGCRSGRKIKAVSRRQTMTKAIRFEKTGGPEVMKWVDVDVGEPGKGEIRVKHHAVGLNFIDVYFRTGLYPMPLPNGLGMEAAGEGSAVGEGGAQVKGGDRVAYASRPPGAYAEERVMAVNYVVHLPDAISYEDAASIMLQGLTTQYLLRRTYRVKAGD